MKAIARSLIAILVALIAVPALAVSYTIATAVQLLAVTGLYMGGTEHPLSIPPDTPAFINEYMDLADDNYIIPGTGDDPTSRVAVVYPAQFFPVFGSTTFDDSVDAGRTNLNSCIRGGPCNGGAPVPREAGDTFIVFGYSQSAVVASLVKQDLIDDPAGVPADTKIVILSNPMRKNGGILGRGFEDLTIPGLGITFYGVTPTNSCDLGTCLDTDDVAQQYDILGGDAPARLDPLAFANSIAAYALLHGDVPNRTIDGSDPEVIFQDEYGDTEYYMITAPRVPLLLLVEQAGVPGPVLAIPDALLRVWIEDKYRRDLSPGEHVQFQFSPIGNPISLVGNMLGAIPVGIDDTVQQATGPGSTLRPLGTADVYRPFGVGGTVYDKTTGLPTTDDNVLPFNSANNDLALEQPEVGENKLANEETEELGNDVTPDSDTTPEVTRPRPLQVLRDSLKFDPENRPSGIRPNGDGPLKRIVNALTGQRPEPAADAEAKDDQPNAEDDAA